MANAARIKKLTLNGTEYNIVASEINSEGEGEGAILVSNGNGGSEWRTEGTGVQGISKTGSAEDAISGIVKAGLGISIDRGVSENSFSVSSIPYLTEPPTQANPEPGTLKIVVLTEQQAQTLTNPHNGYLYLILGDA